MTFPSSQPTASRPSRRQRLPQAFVLVCCLAAGVVELMALQRRRWQWRQTPAAFKRPF